MTTKIIVTGEHADVRCPYRLKYICAEMPERRWVADRKVWRIPAADLGLAVAAFRRAGELVDVVDRRPRSTAAAPTDWASAMFAALPARLRAPAYRALARYPPPDGESGE